MTAEQIIKKPCITVVITEHKKFTKSVHAVDGKIFLIIRFMKDDSGYIYERKMCEKCGMKMKGAKIKLNNGESFQISCPNPNCK